MRSRGWSIINERSILDRSELLLVLFSNSSLTLRCRCCSALASGQSELLDGEQEKESKHGSDGDGDEDLVEGRLHGHNGKLLLVLAKASDHVDVVSDG